jgi:hypothetical protein
VCNAGLNLQRLEADHSPPSASEIKNGGAVPPLLHMSSCHSAQATSPLTLTVPDRMGIADPLSGGKAVGT